MAEIKEAYEGQLKNYCEWINHAYYHDIDSYEDLIERYAARLGVSYEWLEDTATCVRHRGWDND